LEGHILFYQKSEVLVYCPESSLSIEYKRDFLYQERIEAR